MTRLEKVVRRETDDRYAGRPLIVELSRDGIRVKEKGRRTWYGPYPVVTLFKRLGQMEADRIVRERKARRKSRRKT